MKKTLYCVRHGQSLDESQRWFSGRSDHPLTDQGRKEAHHMGFRFHVTPVDAIFSSPLERAVATAGIIRRYVPFASFQVEPYLQEWNREGILTGLTYEQAKRHYPEELEKLKFYRAHAACGEPYNDFSDRVKQAFASIIASPYKRVMIVTHGNVIGSWLREAYFMPHHPHQVEHPDHIVQVKLNQGFRPESVESYFIQSVDNVMA